MVKAKRKPKKETTCNEEENNAKRRKLGPMFGGALEEDIRLKTLPDLIKYDLDILFVGINPGKHYTHCITKRIKQVCLTIVSLQT